MTLRLLPPPEPWCDAHAYVPDDGTTLGDPYADREAAALECRNCRFGSQALVINPESGFYLRRFPVARMDEDNVYVKSWDLVLTFGRSEVRLSA